VGVSVDLAGELARCLGLPLSLLVVEKAALSVDAVKSEQADLGFFAIDPQRSDGIAFTQAYLQIEGAYLVRQDSALTRIDEVDAPGQRVVVSLGSAYDLHLSRSLAHAQIERAPRPTEVMAWFHDQAIEVAAGIRPQLVDEAARNPSLRVLPGHFMVIQQAMGLPAGRPTIARQALSNFLTHASTSGFIRDSLARHGITAATEPAP
jgi:polar amino acid transport system substrate-binding protein